MILQLGAVTVRRGKTTILDHITWSMNEGEHWVVLGPNGAGKTTLVQLAAARLYPTRGDIRILGEKLSQVDLGELRSRIGLSSSALEAQLSPRERVLDVVLTASYGTIAHWEEEYEELDVKRAHDLLAAFNVERFAGRAFGTLSEGERKRVQVARSLMSDPELLILDEPASGLDLSGREILLGALDEIVRDPNTPSILMVTHHVEEIPSAFTHAIMLREGKLMAAGPLDEVMTSENLTRTFGIPLTVEVHDGRYAAWGRR